MANALASMCERFLQHLAVRDEMLHVGSRLKGVPVITRSWLVMTLVLMPFASAAQTPGNDREQIIAAVQGFFDSMEKRDPMLAERVMIPDARIYAFAERDGKPTMRVSVAQDYIKGLSTGKGELLERMWEPEVRIRGPIATVWTKYDFHRNGTFSRCGVDAFDLVRTPDGWKIAGAMYTVEPTGCAPSPLGPLKK